MTHSIYVVCEETEDDLGVIRRMFEPNGYAAKVHTRRSANLAQFNPDQFAALIIMGGSGEHPTYEIEYRILQTALDNLKPILAICQGFQLLATLASRNPAAIKKLKKPDGADKGFSHLRLTPNGKLDSVLRPIAESGAKMAQWHTCAATMPIGAECLAMSSNGLHCDAFKLNSISYALQFHPEVPSEKLPSWSGDSQPTSDELRIASACGERVVQAWFDLLNTAPNHE